MYGEIVMIYFAIIFLFGCYGLSMNVVALS